MIQGGGGASLQQKTVQSRGLAGKLRRKELESHAASESKILGFVNHAHAATAQTAGNAVMRDGLADHARPIIIG